MTLLTTEIYRHDQADAIIVFAADRRITRRTVRDSEQPKIFRLPRLCGGIGYFGLAEVPSSTGTEPMAAWLWRFLSGTTAGTLKALADELAQALNVAVPEDWQRSEVSGFHLCGFAAAGRPEFWYVRNCDDTEAQTPIGRYESREDFQGRDAPKIPPGEGLVYRNGDIWAHVAAWERLDQAFGTLLTAPDFGAPASPAEYERWVEFKMDVIAQFYERFCRVSIIGRPVDVFSVTW
jgi:hypothetical protein